ncbi:MAG TPA: hypothetical protein VF765_07580 [Polyangiaceae bacterium]
MRPLVLAVTTPLALASIEGGHLGSLPPPPGPRAARSAMQAALEAKPVCIGSSVESAGALGDVLYYRAATLPDGRVAVGYFAFFSEERPWGNNWLTWTVVPALAVDLVYSRALLVAPGIQRAMYGAGDVEGLSIVYAVGLDGALSFDHATADDRTEQPVVISRERAYALDPAHPVFYSDVWSHQLGGTGAASRQNLAYLRCYEGDAIRPLPDDLARAYHLENRADPAHVERLGGVAIR